MTSYFDNKLKSMVRYEEPIVLDKFGGAKQKDNSQYDSQSLENDLQKYCGQIMFAMQRQLKYPAVFMVNFLNYMRKKRSADDVIRHYNFINIEDRRKKDYIKFDEELKVIEFPFSENDESIIAAHKLNKFYIMEYYYTESTSEFLDFINNNVFKLVGSTKKYITYKDMLSKISMSGYKPVRLIKKKFDEETNPMYICFIKCEKQGSTNK